MDTTLMNTTKSNRATLHVEVLEAREVPAVTLPTSPNFAAVGVATTPHYLATAQADGGGLVRVFDFKTGTELFKLRPFGNSYTGGVRVATGDVNGDGTPDIICASVVGTGTTVRVFNGINAAEIASFQPFGTKYAGGASVAVADFNGDGKADIVAGGGNHNMIKVFNGATVTGTPALLARFAPFASTYKGGVRVATGDITRDGVADIAAVTARGRAVVEGFSGTTIGNTTPFQPFAPYFASGASATGGAWISVGDVNGDGFADVATGNGNGKAQVRIIDGKTLPAGGNPTLIRTLVLSPSVAAVGARVRLVDLNGDGTMEAVVSANTGDQPAVDIYNATTGALLTAFYASGTGFLGGIDVG